MTSRGVVSGNILTRRGNLRIPKLPNSSGWFGRRYHLVKEFIALARANGATRKPWKRTNSSTATTVMSQDSALQLEEDTVKSLQETFPQSPPSEILRFLRACGGDTEKASVKLQTFLDWRQLHGLDNPDYQEEIRTCESDKEDWIQSCRKAVEFLGQKDTELSRKKKLSRGCKGPEEPFLLPQIIFVYKDGSSQGMLSKTGYRLLHVMPALIDKKLANAETYALALAFYLDRQQNRNSLDEFFVLLDVRPGLGWANTPAYNMMPFIKATGNLLHQHFPERLGKFLVYPLPRPAIWIWEMVKPFLDNSVVEAAHLIGGKDSIQAPPPNHVLQTYIDDDNLDRMEKNRMSMFKSSS
jgi:hypothetical protein